MKQKMTTTTVMMMMMVNLLFEIILPQLALDLSSFHNVNKKFWNKWQKVVKKKRLF